jgi:hypothetical protein
VPAGSVGPHGELRGGRNGEAGRDSRRRYQQQLVKHADERNACILGYGGFLSWALTNLKFFPLSFFFFSFFPQVLRQWFGSAADTETRSMVAGVGAMKTTRVEEHTCSMRKETLSTK